MNPWDAGYGKERTVANLREHVKESLTGIVEGMQRANNDLLAERLEEVKKLEEEEYVLVSTGGDRATLRDVRKRLRNARNAITVLRKGNPTLEKRLADPGLYRDVVLVPADKLPLRVAKFDVVLARGCVAGNAGDAYGIVANGDVPLHVLQRELSNVPPGLRPSRCGY